MSWGYEPSEATVEALKEIKWAGRQVFAQKKQRDSVRVALKKEEDKLAELTKSLLDLMEKAGMPELAVEGHGKILVDKKTSVKVPKDPEKREQFFGYLKNKGLFEDLVTIHSSTLNSYYNQELSAAKESGQVFEGIPGLEPSGSWSRIKFK